MLHCKYCIVMYYSVLRVLYNNRPYWQPKRTVHKLRGGLILYLYGNWNYMLSTLWRRKSAPAAGTATPLTTLCIVSCCTSSCMCCDVVLLSTSCFVCLYLALCCIEIAFVFSYRIILLSGKVQIAHKYCTAVLVGMHGQAHF